MPYVQAARPYIEDEVGNTWIKMRGVPRVYNPYYHFYSRQDRAYYYKKPRYNPPRPYRLGDRERAAKHKANLRAWYNRK